MQPVGTLSLKGTPWKKTLLKSKEDYLSLRNTHENLSYGGKNGPRCTWNIGEPTQYPCICLHKQEDNPNGPYEMHGDFVYVDEFNVMPYHEARTLARQISTHGDDPQNPKAVGRLLAEIDKFDRKGGPSEAECEAVWRALEDLTDMHYAIFTLLDCTDNPVALGKAEELRKIYL